MGTPKMGACSSERRLLDANKGPSAVERAIGHCKSDPVKYSGGLQVKSGNVLKFMNDLLLPRPRNFQPAPKKSRPKSDGEGDTNLGDITYIEAIGTGSFGAVWKGKCKDQVVAIKKCKVGDSHEAKMLMLEIGFLQKLRHPYLVAYLGCVKKSSNLLLVLEYCGNGSLYNLLFKARKTIDGERKMTWMLHVVEGLAYLHSQSVVHRDLKTMNIVLDEMWNAKICDFGLTVTLEKTHMTVKALQGSPRYMAPEQFETNAKITEKVDIWQLGCVMLELFFLIIPFDKASGVQAIATDLLVKKKPPAVPMNSSNDLRHSCLTKVCLKMRLMNMETEHEPHHQACTEATQS